MLSYQAEDTFNTFTELLAWPVNVNANKHVILEVINEIGSFNIHQHSCNANLHLAHWVIHLGF